MLASANHQTDDVRATQGLLALVDMLRKARDFYRQEADIAFYSGLNEPPDSIVRAEALLNQYAVFARRVGLQLNRATVRAILDHPIPVCVVGLSSQELSDTWVFNPVSGWRRK